MKWEIDKPFKKILGLYHNELLVAVDEHILLLIDANSGKILHKWNELEGFEAGSFYRNILPSSTNFVLDRHASKLIGVFHTYYFEIDLMTKKINYIELKEELAKYSISDFRSFNNNPFTSDHLFLTAHTYLDDFPNVDFSSVLALNRHTNKIDWIHTFEEGGLGTNIPQITSAHLYQKDLKENLYIFEKQV